MKVTMQHLYAGPDGVAKQGTVIDLSEQRAKEFIDGRHARPYDRDKDARAPQGMQRAPSDFEQ